MDGVVRKFEKAVVVSFFAFIGAILISNLSSSYSWLGYNLEKQNKYILILTPIILLCVIILSLYQTKKKSDILKVSVIVAITLIQILFVEALSTQTGWDSGAVINAALQTDIQASSQYLSVYPNNLILVFMYKFVFSLFRVDINHAYFVASIMNVFIVDLSVYMMTKICLHCFGQECNRVFCFFSFLFLLFSPWLIIPYSDVVAMMFVVSTVFWYLKLGRFENVLLRCILFGLLGGWIAIGIKIKPTTVVAIVTIFIHARIKGIKKKETNDFKFFCVLLLGMTIILWLINSLLERQDVFELDATRKMTMTHYMMMSLNDNLGVYTDEDYWISQSASNVDERQQVNMKEIKKRLKDKGLAGYFEGQWKRSRQIFGEGNFNWGGEAGAYFINYDFNQHPILRNLFYTRGCNYGFYFYGSQAAWFTVLALLILNSFRIIKYGIRDEELLFILPIIGVWLFQLIFESRSRYLIAFLPFILAESSAISVEIKRVGKIIECKRQSLCKKY
ncbi:MAG: hypothetical protein K6G07_06465 [Lachnospiraceae bacterium]|nr:hypothetical protein [Lachnospiraceae bacterium]